MRRLGLTWCLSLIVIGSSVFGSSADAAESAALYYCELDIFSGGPTESCPYFNPENFEEYLCGMCAYDCQPVGPYPEVPDECLLNLQGEPTCLYSSDYECQFFEPGLYCDDDFWTSNYHNTCAIE